MTIFKRKTTQHLLNIIVFALCLVMVVTGYKITLDVGNIQNNIQNTIIQTWREQARRTLLDLKEQFITGVNDGTIDIDNDPSINHWSSINLAGIRNGGNTSDGFLIKMPQELFEWDGSADCAKPEFLIHGRYLKDEAVLHQRPDLAMNIINEMRKLYDTKSGDNRYWQFDDSKEHLEWIIIPKETKGFDNEPLTIGGAINPNYRAFIMVLGTQEDEIMQPYEAQLNKLTNIQNGITTVITIASILSILNMIIFVYLAKRGD